MIELVFLPLFVAALFLIFALFATMLLLSFVERLLPARGVRLKALLAALPLPTIISTFLFWSAYDIYHSEWYSSVEAIRSAPDTSELALLSSIILGLLCIFSILPCYLLAKASLKRERQN